MPQVNQLFRYFGSKGNWAGEGFKWLKWSSFQLFEGDTTGEVAVEMSLNIPDETDLHGEEYGTDVGAQLATFFIGEGPSNKLRPERYHLNNQSDSSTILKRLIDVLDLGTSMDYAMGFIAGIGALGTNAVGDQTYALAYHPKLVAIWSVSKTRQSLTRAVVLGGVAECKYLREVLNIKWDPEVVSHALFPCLVCSMVLSTVVDEAQEQFKLAIRPIEARTGYHKFSSRSEKPANQNFSDLSAEVSGHAGKLASTARKIHVARKLQQFMIERAHEEGVSGGADTIKKSGVMLDERLEMQLLDNEYLLERARIQLAAILNLLSRLDTRIALNVAETSMLDSAAMKALAVVALVFLPGNFVAAIFSTGLITWEDSKDDQKPRGFLDVKYHPQFGLFWLVTLSLTSALSVSYGVWWWRRKLKWTRGLGDSLEGRCRADLGSQATPSTYHDLRL